MLSTMDMKIVLEHWLWSGVILAVLIWYSTITIYVAIRGASDIKHMFARLNDLSAAETLPDRKNSPPAER